MGESSSRHEGTPKYSPAAAGSLDISAAGLLPGPTRHGFLSTSSRREPIERGQLLSERIVEVLPPCSMMRVEPTTNPTFTFLPAAFTQLLAIEMACLKCHTTSFAKLLSSSASAMSFGNKVTIVGPST